MGRHEDEIEAGMKPFESVVREWHRGPLLELLIMGTAAGGDASAGRDARSIAYIAELAAAAAAAKMPDNVFLGLLLGRLCQRSPEVSLSSFPSLKSGSSELSATPREPNHAQQLEDGHSDSWIRRNASAKGGTRESSDATNDGARLVAGEQDGSSLRKRFQQMASVKDNQVVPVMAEERSAKVVPVMAGTDDPPAVGETGSDRSGPQLESMGRDCD